MQCVGSVYRSCGCLAVPLMLVIRCPTQFVYIMAKKISPELEKFMNLHQLTLTALLSHEDAALLAMDGFGWRLMKEVLELREV